MYRVMIRQMHVPLQPLPQLTYTPLLSPPKVPIMPLPDPHFLSWPQADAVLLSMTVYQIFLSYNFIYTLCSFSLDAFYVQHNVFFSFRFIHIVKYVSSSLILVLSGILLCGYSIFLSILQPTNDQTVSSVWSYE